MPAVSAQATPHAWQTPGTRRRDEDRRSDARPGLPDKGAVWEERHWRGSRWTARLDRGRCVLRYSVPIRRGRTLGILATAVAVAVLGAIPADAASKTPLNTNLVKDAGAEQASAAGLDGTVIVPIPRWVTENGFTAAAYGASGCPTTSQAAAIGGGKYLFFGGPDSEQSTASQDITLVGRSSAVDAHRVKLSLSAWLGGWDGQGDSARVQVRFLRANGSQIGSVSTVAVSGTNSVLKHKTAGKLLPTGTRKIRIVLISTRAEGTNNDGMFDKIDVRIKLPS